MQNLAATHHLPALKAEVAIAALRGERSIPELAAQYQVHPNEVSAWSAQLQKSAANLFGGADKDVPRALPRNPYGQEFAGHSLEERVRLAMVESARFGRTIGAIVMQSIVYEENAAPVSTALLEDIAIHLGSKLRTSDCVMPRGETSIVIYVSLLNTLDDLHSIARRMHITGKQFLDNNAHPEYTLGAPGVALCPLDGDGAESLFAAASGRTRKT